MNRGGHNLFQLIPPLGRAALAEWVWLEHVHHHWSAIGFDIFALIHVILAVYLLVEGKAAVTVLHETRPLLVEQFYFEP
jgi:hypothetical protein